MKYLKRGGALLPLLVFFLCCTSFGEESGDSALIYDSSGNPLNSTSSALNSFVTNFPATFGVTQSTSPWVISGTVQQGSPPWSVSQSGTWTTGRTWTLSSSTDSVTLPAIGTVGSTARSSAIEIGGPDNSGNLQTATVVTLATTPLGTDYGFTTNSLIYGLTTAGGGGYVPVKVNPSGTMLVDASGATVPVSQSGTWNINNITGTISLPTGASTSANQTNGNQKTQIVDGSGNVIASTSNSLNVDVTNTVAISGTVTANQGTSPWVTNVTQFGSNNVVTGTGASGSGIPRVTVSNDSNILATQSGTWTVQQGGAPWSQNITQIGGSSLTLGQKAAASSIPVVTQQDAAPATINITTQDTGSTTTVVANGQSFVTGTPTANSTASFALSSFEAVEVQVTGTWTGTLVTEVSMDGGTTWFSRGVKQSGVAYITNSFTANFEGGMNFAGMTNVRVRATAAMTGTATVMVVASVNPGSITVSNALTLRDSTTQSISDTIKAASTAASATDTALVVAISPNNTVAVTQSTSPWVDNITQFGGTNVSTGTGASGSGIPRVTVSNDSYLSDRNVTGNITDQCPTGVSCSAASVVVANTDGMGSLGFETHGTWSATLTTDLSYDSTCFTSQSTANWYNTPSLDTDGSRGQWILNWGSGLNNDSWLIPVAGAKCMRLRALSYTSGTVNATLNGSQGTSVVWGVVDGNIGSGSTDLGNPVKIGGIFNTTQPTVSNGQRVDAQSTSRGALIVATGPDNLVVTPNQVVNTDINGSALTTTGNTSAISMSGYPGMDSFINVTAVSGTNPTLDMALQGSLDQSNWFTIHGFKRFTATGNDFIGGVKINYPYYRWAHTIGGTTPSFTVTITTAFRTTEAVKPQHYISQAAALSLTALNSSALVNLADCNAFTVEISRVGGGGTAGNIAFNVLGSINGVDTFTIGTTAAIAQTAFTTFSWTSNTGVAKNFQVANTSTNASGGTASVYWYCNN